MNHSALAEMSVQLERIRTLIEIQDDVLKSEASDLVSSAPLYTKIDGARSLLIAAQQKCEHLLI